MIFKCTIKINTVLNNIGFRTGKKYGSGLVQQSNITAKNGNID
jgi:hypothetical protein